MLRTTTGNDQNTGNRITHDELAIIVRRIDRMEVFVGKIVSRVRGKDGLGRPNDPYPFCV